MTARVASGGRRCPGSETSAVLGKGSTSSETEVPPSLGLQLVAGLRDTGAKVVLDGVHGAAGRLGAEVSDHGPWLRAALDSWSHSLGTAGNCCLPSLCDLGGIFHNSITPCLSVDCRGHGRTCLRGHSPTYTPESEPLWISPYTCVCDCTGKKWGDRSRLHPAYTSAPSCC